MNLTVVTISHQPEKLELELPYVCWIGKDRRMELPRSTQKSSPERVNFLAALRDTATGMALHWHRDTTHILNIESYYLGQTETIQALIRSYRDQPQDSILGGCVWGRQADRHTWFYDTWAFPEMAGYTFRDHPRGIVRVSSVGSAFIMPVDAYRKNRFTNEGFPERFYYNNLCRGFACYVDGNVNFYRDRDF